MAGPQRSGKSFFVLQTLAVITCHVTKQHWAAYLWSKNSLLPLPHFFPFSFFLPFVICRGWSICTPRSMTILFFSLFLIYLLLFTFFHPIFLCLQPLGNHSHLYLMSIFCTTHSCIFWMHLFFFLKKECFVIYLFLYLTFSSFTLASSSTLLNVHPGCLFSLLLSSPWYITALGCLSNLHWWISRLPPTFCHYKWHHNEHLQTRPLKGLYEVLLGNIHRVYFTMTKLC